MTKKDFVLEVTDAVIENPRAVLAGHGIPAAVLGTIAKRPDVIAKLATVLYDMKAAKRGAKGMKKAANFGIKAYKTFAELNTKARADIEGFVGGLDGGDMSSFSNSDNIITICMLPDTKAMVTGKELDEVEEKIVSGKSVVLGFDSAVRKEYKIPGGQYVVIMWGNSAIRPQSEKLAARKEKVNARKVAKRTPAKIKASLRKKANTALGSLSSKRAAMQQQAYGLGMQMQQQAYLADKLGTDDLMYGVGKANMAASNYQINRNAIIAGLSASDKTIYQTAQKLIKSGNKTAATAVVNTIKDAGAKAKLRALLSGKGTPTSGDSIVAGRKTELRKQLNKLRQRGEQLLLDLALAKENGATTKEILSVRSMISKNNAQIKALRAKLGTYKNMSQRAHLNKAEMMRNLNAAIEANIAEGNSITQALNAALASINASPAQKQVLKQQVMQQVADGMPVQYATQQAIQDLQIVSDVDMDDTSLSGTYDIEQLLAQL